MLVASVSLRNLRQSLFHQKIVFKVDVLRRVRKRAHSTKQSQRRYNASWKRKRMSSSMLGFVVAFGAGQMLSRSNR